MSRKYTKSTIAKRVVRLGKRTLDRVIEPAAFWVGANGLVLTGLYQAGNFIADKAPWLANAVEYWEPTEVLTKLGICGTVAYLANKKAIWPWTKRIAKRKMDKRRIPSKLSYAKTVAMGVALTATTILSGIPKDLSRIYHDIKTAKSFWDYPKILTNELRFGLINDVITGRRANEVGSKFLATFNLEDLLQYETDSQTSKQITKELKRIRTRNPNFAYSGQVSRDAAALSNYVRTPEELAYITRVVYFEGGLESQGGREAIAHVMKHRLNYDKNQAKKHEKQSFSRKSPKGGLSLADIVFLHGTNSGGGTTWQFSCISGQAKYFYEHEGKSGWNMYGNDGEINVCVGHMNKKRTKQVYKAVIDVLSERVKDNTNGALFYQNPKYVDKHNTPKKWIEKGLKHVKTIGNHWFFRPDDLEPDWHNKMGLNNYTNSRTTTPKYGKQAQTLRYTRAPVRKPQYHRRINMHRNV